MTVAAFSSASGTRDFRLNATQWALFTALLVAPTRDNPRLRAFLSSRRGETESAPLTPADDIRRFSCGVHLLDETLTRDARASSSSSDEFARRTFVMRRERRVVAYYAQRLCVIRRACADVEADAVPIMQLQRLAVDRSTQGRGVGTTMLREAVSRALTIGERYGARALCVHALSPEVKQFYLERGLQPMPSIIDPLGLLLSFDAVRKASAI